jgi:hypothetical protein
MVKILLHLSIQKESEVSLLVIVHPMLYDMNLCPDLCLQHAKDALGMILANIEMSKGSATVNTSLYCDLTTKFQDLLPLNFQFDSSFVDAATRANSLRHERLEQELNSYKSSLIKESIRVYEKK